MFRIPAIPLTCAEAITRNTKPRNKDNHFYKPQTPSISYQPLKYIEALPGNTFVTNIMRVEFPLLAWCLTNIQNITTLRANNLKTISTTYTWSLFLPTRSILSLIPFLWTLWWPWWSLIFLCPSFPLPPTPQLLTGGHSPGKETLYQPFFSSPRSHSRWLPV